MELIFRQKLFGIARIYGPGTSFPTGGRIKILPDFKFPQNIHVLHIVGSQNLH